MPQKMDFIFDEALVLWISR